MKISVPVDIARIEEEERRLRIEIPPDATARPRLSAGLGMALLGVAIVSMSGISLRGSLGLSISLIGLGLIGVCLVALRRQRRFVHEGTEIIEVDGQRLTISHLRGGARNDWSFPLADLSRLRFETPPAELSLDGSVPPLHGSASVFLAATFRVTPLRFGIGLQAAEARRVLRRLGAFLERTGNGSIAQPSGEEEVIASRADLAPAATPLMTRPHYGFPGVLAIVATLLLALVTLGQFVVLVIDGGAPDATATLISALPHLLFGIVVLPVLAFTLAGGESLEIAGGELVVTRRLFGFSRSQRFELAAVQRPRVNRGARDHRPRDRRDRAWAWPFITPLEGMVRRRLLFDYGAATVDCGAFLNEAEAMAAAAGLTAALPGSTDDPAERSAVAEAAG